MSSVCRICLAGNTRLHSVNSYLLRHIYEKLSDNKFNFEDARPRALCCFCYQKLLRCHSFSEMAQRSEKIFSQLYEKGLEATPECMTEGNLGMEQHLSVVTLEYITFDGKASIAGTQVTIKEEALPEDLPRSIDIKGEEISEPDQSAEPESDPQNCTKSLITLHVGNNDQGNDDKEVSDIHVEQTIPDDSKMPFNIKDERPSIDIKEEVTTEPGALVEVEYSTQDCIKSELTIGDNCEHENEMDKNLFNINVEQTKPDDDKMPYICKDCNKIFYIKDNLISHIRNSHCQLQYSLQERHTEATGNIENKKHIEATSNIKDTVIHKENKLFSCDLCDKTFGYKSSLVYHLGTHNTAKPEITKNQFSCDLCGKNFGYKSSLVYHLRTHTTARPAVPRSVACRVCDKRFSEMSILLTHMKIHLGEKPFACNLCDKQFKHKPSLDCHMRVHTGEKPYLCNVCDKTFIRRDSLIFHMRTHTGEIPFECQICKKQFNRKGNIDVHMKIHTGEKPFECQLCDKRYITRTRLVQHNRIHTGEKPFACNVCDKQFYRKSYLVPHMRTHTNEKPFPCQGCEKRFKRKEQLVEHIRCHTGEKPFVCNICEKKFSYKSAYSKHMKIHTRDDLRYS